MKIDLELSKGFEQEIKAVVIQATREVLFTEGKRDKETYNKEWLNIKEAAKYAGVSYNTFLRFREMGLKFTEINGIKRVSKTKIDEFLVGNSF